ncbi:hypothetical protein C8Q76DRAFT_609267, partial [Earliella scabrosa]
YKRAANAELARDFDKAFRLYLGAADQFLQLSRQTAQQKMRALYKAEAAKALERAEKIKTFKQDIKPVAKNEFADGEQRYVLQKSSLINQGFFPIWDSSERPSSSSEQPPLSREQLQHGASWKRPVHGATSASVVSGHELHPEDIVQHIVSDCSVCGAIVVAIDHHRRRGSKARSSYPDLQLILSSLYPQDEHGLPAISDTGQYHVKTFYNGAYRRVSIDDQLPAYPDGTLMCVSTGDRGHIWPSLVEKAYMKLAGGYDFIGSALAGWIPEVLDIKGPHFQREKTWDRLIRGYTTGNCVATLGTGELVRDTETVLALLPTHCYAIIGEHCVHDTEDDRGLTIFDPWVQPDQDTHSRRDRKPSIALATCAGKVTLSMESVYRIFDGIYFSWDPAIFKHKLTFHGYARRSPTDGGSAAHFRAQVKFSVDSTSQDDEVWILLTRHIRSHRAKDEFIALTAHTGGVDSSTTGGDVLSTKVRGDYTNSPHVLAKTSVSGTDDLIALVASYEGEREDVGFTLTVYSNCQASCMHNPQKLLYSKELEGAFTQKTAGGNHTYPTYYLNPQYYLRIHPRAASAARGKDSRDAKATIAVTVSTDRQIPVNIMLAWSQGARLNELSHNDLALSSGPYSYGCAHATGKVPPGDYTLVVSPFEPRHLGKFSLHLECSDRFDITPIQQEGAGMFTKPVIRGQWTAETAGGHPSSGEYASNPMYELHVPSTSQLKFRLQLADPSPSIALNLTIFDTSSGSALGNHVATSGFYSDAPSGVLIDKITLQPGRYLVVPSTYKPGVQATFKLIVYSTTSAVQLTPVK